MMYQSKLVASLKANGKILREFKDTVYIPFGSEYSFLIKNLHTTRAVVNIFIDSENVVESGLVVDPGREVNLERYIKNGNLTEGNRFKFIERTAGVEKHRGVKLEDGIVRIEFQYEQPRPVTNISDMMWKTEWPVTDNGTFRYTSYGGDIGTAGRHGDRFSVTASGVSYSTNVNGAMRGVDFSQGEAVKAAASSAINQVAPQSTEIHDGMATMDWNEVGITVPGSRSNQTFTHVTMGTMEPTKHSIVIRLLGETPNNKPVLEPVTVERKPKCVTCGKQNKARAKFCAECGTALEVFA